MSDSSDPRDADHAPDVVLGGSGEERHQRKRPPRRPSVPRRSIYLRIVDTPVTYEPRAGLPAGGRNECRNGERPCPYVRCKWHLWRVDGHDRPGPRYGGRLPPTTLIPAWLEYPTPPCCALDVAESVDPDAHGIVTRVADWLHLSRNTTQVILAGLRRKLQALSVENDDVRELVALWAPRG